MYAANTGTNKIAIAAIRPMHTHTPICKSVHASRLAVVAFPPSIIFSLNGLHFQKIKSVTIPYTHLLCTFN